MVVQRAHVAIDGDAAHRDFGIATAGQSHAPAILCGTKVAVSEEPPGDARTKARHEVQAALALRSEVPERRCPFCGHTEHTRFEHCSECGQSLFDRPPRLSPRQRRGAIGAALVAAIAGLIVLVPALVGYRQRSDRETRTTRDALVRTERARLVREQRPHDGRLAGARPGATAPAARRLAARRELVASLERSITADARARRARGEIDGSPFLTTRCSPLTRNQKVGDEGMLTLDVGRWSCTAVQQDSKQADGEVVGYFGIPFVASANFRTYTYVWCKDNPVSNPGSVGDRLAFVRLSRRCLAAKGPAFGSGYVLEDPGG